MLSKSFRASVVRQKGTITAAEFAAARSTLGMTVEEFADLADLTLFEAEEIEAGRRRADGEVAWRVRSAVYEVEHARTMAACEVPECAIATRLAADAERALAEMEARSDSSRGLRNGDFDAVDEATTAMARHAERCATCRARAEWAKRHAPKPPQPEFESLPQFAWTEWLVAWLPPPLRPPEGVAGAGRRGSLGLSLPLGVLVVVRQVGMALGFVTPWRTDVAPPEHPILRGLILATAFVVGGWLAGWAVDATRPVRHRFLGALLRGVSVPLAGVVPLSVALSLTNGFEFSLTKPIILLPVVLGLVVCVVLWVRDRVRGSAAVPDRT